MSPAGGACGRKPAPARRRTEEVVIAGAGLSGLFLANELLDRGLTPLVLETRAWAGGKARTRRESGFLLEEGPAGILDRESTVASLVRALGLADRALAATAASQTRMIVLNGRLHAVPSSPLDFLRSKVLPLRGKLRVFGDLLLPRGPSARGGDESVASFAERRFGRLAADRLFYPLVSGIYAGDPACLSLAASFPQIAALERRDRSLIFGAVRSRGRGVRAPLTSFREGIQELVEGLARRLGDRLQLGSPVRRLDALPEGFRLHLDTPAGEREIACERVVLAMPSHAAAPIVEEALPVLAEAVRRIPYAPVAIVHLGYDAADVSRRDAAYGFLVPPSENMRILGAVFASDVFEGRAEPGKRLYSVRLGGVRSPSLLGLTDHELVEIARGDMGRLLGIVAPPELAHVVRHARGLPQYTLEHRSILATIDATEARWPGLFFHGDAYRGLGIVACLRTSRSLAERMVSKVAATPAVS